MVSQNLVKFCVHAFSAGGDIMYLSYHMTSQDHLIEGSYLQYVTTLIILAIISIAIVKM